MSRHLRRLLFVTDAPHFGGAEQYILSMCRVARAREIDTRVCWLPPAGASRDVFAKASEIPAPHGASGSTHLNTLRNLLREFRPDVAIINASGRPRFWMTPWVARLAGVPSAWVHHMVDTRDHRRLAPRRFGGRLEGLQTWRVPQVLRHRMAAAGADAVIVSNQRDADWLLRWQQAPRKRLHIVPPGIDGERFRPSPSRCGGGEPFVIGTAARLVRGKGIERLIEAVTMLRGRGVQVIALIAGDGPDASLFRQMAERLRVADSVQFVGQTEDMPGFYSRLDAFVLASDTESFGLAIAEAMACGLPVIATPTAGARTQIDHLRSGFLLRSFAAEELVNAVAELQCDVALRARLAAAARVSVLERFSIEQTFDNTLALLQRRPASRSSIYPAGAPALSASISSVREVA